MKLGEEGIATPHIHECNQLSPLISFIKRGTNLNKVLTKEPPKLGHGWIITPHMDVIIYPCTKWSKIC